jgi:hypothetical protein
MNISDILSMAKETVLHNGGHAPMLYVEGEQGDVTMAYFADLPGTTFEKQIMLFGLGREHGIAHPGNRVQKVYSISEAWVSTAMHKGKPKYNAPSEDPNKKEMLIVLYLDGSTAKTTMHRFEMLRDGEGAFMGLLTIPGEMGDMHDRLLPSFLAGTLSAKMSDRELGEMLAKGRS